MSSEYETIKIRTPSRLHFTLIDLNGELGRIDGGIGVALARPNWDIQISKQSTWSVPEEINDFVEGIRQNMKLEHNYKIKIGSKLPSHVGLGSQTQLGLALAKGISVLEGYDYSIVDLASLVGRGGTSGIGIAAYEHGGFILDGGHSRAEKPDFLPSHYSSAKPAILVNRFEMPQDWHFIVGIPAIGVGKHGAEEVEIFNKHCPIPSADVEKLSRIILMQILPAISEHNLERFGAGLTKIQSIGFKRIENELQSDIVQSLQQFYLENGAAGTGLSSFGPATFAVVESELKAKDLVTKTEEYLKNNGIIGTIFYTGANNTGAKIEIQR
jgi:beta-ribofuranosylaminobenzene 5'-phosphate synthase